MTDKTSFPLFYTKPTALDKVHHKNISLNPELSFKFAAHVNAVPITAIELPDVMAYYPIAFSMTSPVTPLAILGLRAKENLFVDAQGRWAKDIYIPAYVRRYPFIFARNDQGDRLTLCIDDAPTILQQNDSAPLFDAHGHLTPMTESALEFCRSYQAAAEQTEEFMLALETSNILIDRHAEIHLQDGTALTLSGFRQIDETKFKTLDEKIVLEWHKKGWMRFIYAHFFSEMNWQKLYLQIENAD